MKSVVPNILITVSGKKEKLPLSVTHPELAKEAFGWDPSAYTFGSGKKVKWRCSKSHEYEASISNRARLSSGCPICAGRKVLIGFNDLQTLHPEIADEAFEWDPRTVVRSTHALKKWRCPKQHVYESTVAHRTSKEKRGCPVCAGKTIIIGVNDLKTLFPEIAIQADGWDPREITPGSDKKLPWVCKKGHKYKASVGSRTNLKTDCPICDNKIVQEGFNDLKTKFPLIAEEAIGWNPAHFTPSSHKKMSWKCSQGHIYVASIAHRTSRDKTGCPTCGLYGFDSNKKGFLYLIAHSSWGMLQVGISNNLDRRINEHGRAGWELLDSRGPMDGWLTQQWETAILRMLKANGADLSNEKISGKFDGYSEAWSKSTFEVSSIKQLMKLTAEYEGNQ